MLIFLLVLLVVAKQLYLDYLHNRLVLVGMVTRTWNPPSDDKGFPTLGYYIYRRSGDDGEKVFFVKLDLTSHCFR